MHTQDVVISTIIVERRFLSSIYLLVLFFDIEFKKVIDCPNVSTTLSYLATKREINSCFSDQSNRILDLVED